MDDESEYAPTCKDEGENQTGPGTLPDPNQAEQHEQ
jgi:hypothetical protein